MGFKKSVQLMKKPNFLGVRHFQALLWFFGMAVCYSLRVNISAAIVPMTKPTGNAPHYDWDLSTKSLVLSSFFWGYVVVQLPVGMLAKRFGGKLLWGLATLVCSVVTILHPWAASGGSWQVLCVLRALVGMTQGVLYPSMHTLLSRWAPRTERSSMTTMSYSGGQLGAVFLLATSGPIFNSGMGWPGLFYISGGCALVWSLLFLYFGASSPQESKLISEEERDYIEQLTGGDSKSELMAIPWKSFFTSAPFFGLVVTQTGSVWGYYTLLNEIPTYLDKVLKFNVTSNALLSSLPYLTNWSLSFIVSPISDMVVNRNILSTTNSRKVFNTLGQWIPMACLIAMSYMTKETRCAAVALLSIAVGANAFAVCGHFVNHMDLAPNFAGTLMSIANSVTNFCSIFTPIVVGAVVKDEEDPKEWRVVFFIISGIYLVANSVYLIFAQGTVQPWNDLSKTAAIAPPKDVAKLESKEQSMANSLGIRHFQTLLWFFGMAFGYSLRVNISAAIVPMTKPTGNALYYDWDLSTKSLVLSSFFWGYVVVQLPAGMLAKHFGGKLVWGLATLVCSAVTILHPWAASGGSWQLICVLRVLIGMTQGVIYPSMHTLLSKWAPRTERSSMTTMSYSGGQLGAVLLLATSGPIFDSSMGWPGLFYISGGCALIWSLLFLNFGADSPQKSKMISEKERKYIEQLSGADSKSELMAVPWKSFLTSVPVYGLIIAQAGSVWGFHTLLNEIPTYLDKVLKFNVTSNALLSALPYLTNWLLSFLVSPISDMVINRNILSTTNSRKVFNTLGQWIPMACLIAMSYMTSEKRVAAVALLSIAVGSNVFAFCGHFVNHIDLSPNFAGTLMSFGSSVANFFSIFTPLVVGAVVKDEEDPKEWRVVFFIAAGIYFVANSVFLIFAQGTEQPWNDLSKTSAIASPKYVAKLGCRQHSIENTVSKYLHSR